MELKRAQKNYLGRKNIIMEQRVLCGELAMGR